MSVSTGDILKVVTTLAWSDGNLMQNVFGLLITGGGGPWTDDDVIADLLTWIGLVFGSFGGHMSDEVAGSQIQVYKYDAIGDDFDEVGSTAWTFAPSEVTDQLPRGAALLVGGRSEDPDVLGKKYIGGLCEDNNVDGLWGSVILLAAIDFAEDWIGTFVGGTSAADYTPGVWSVVQKALIPFRDSYYINAIPAYQRRRKRGVGV